MKTTILNGFKLEISEPKTNATAFTKRYYRVYITTPDRDTIGYGQADNEREAVFAAWRSAVTDRVSNANEDGAINELLKAAGYPLTNE